MWADLPLRRALVCTVLCLGLLLSACAPGSSGESSWWLLRGTPRPTPTAHVLVGVNAPPVTRTPLPTATPLPIPAGQGMLDTLAEYHPKYHYDPEASKAAAYATLLDFMNPQGIYRGAWWFEDDQQADIYEVVAVLFYTEGHASPEVRQAIAARYLWYCGGMLTACSGTNLINFLAYFQAWREPEVMGANFYHSHAQTYEGLARELVLQRPGALTTWIPGADEYVHDVGSLEDSYPINWDDMPFHFANVHPSWDVYLRQTLRRGPNGANRLWVLTVQEAERVCGSRFICDYMTRERAQ